MREAKNNIDQFLSFSVIIFENFDWGREGVEQAFPLLSGSTYRGETEVSSPLAFGSPCWFSPALALEGNKLVIGREVYHYMDPIRETIEVTQI